jgi:hypothetical protein
MENDDHSKPILSGVQSNTNSDGTCKYGHKAVEGQCKPGWDCGYTWYDCTCVDEDTAQDQQGEDSLLKLLGGVASILLGIGLLAGLVFVEYNKANKAGASVTPYNVNKPFQHAVGRGASDHSAQKNVSGSKHADASPEFSDPFGVFQHREAKVSQPQSAVANDSKQPYQFEVDGCGLMCIFLLLSLIVMGVVLITLALTADTSEYFNECASA